MPKPVIKHYPDKLVFRVAELFIKKGHSAQETANKISAEFENVAPVKRQSVYPILNEAMRRGFVQLVTPVNQQLADRLASRYRNIARPWTYVVETTHHRDNEKVAAVAAQETVKLCREIAETRESGRVGIGLGPGRATLDFCRHFARLIDAELPAAELALFGITAGAPAEEPEFASSSFFNILPQRVVKKKVGMFAETLIHSSQFDEVRGRTGVREVFEAQDEIDIVITSMGDIHDAHDLLAKFLEQSGEDLADLRSKGWVGNVQYRPYSKDGPIWQKDNEFRAMTLFEIPQLVQMASLETKHVVLIARQCGQCGRSRAEALQPLLTNPKLKVFSRLVMDATTATDLLKGRGKATQPAKG